MVQILNNPITRKFVHGVGKHSSLGLIAMVLIQFASGNNHAQQARVVLEDQKVAVTEIELSSGETYSVPKNILGAVWTALDRAVLVTKKDGSQTSKQVPPGDAQVIRADEKLSFRGNPGQRLRLFILHPRGGYPQARGPTVLCATIVPPWKPTKSRNSPTR